MIDKSHGPRTPCERLRRIASDPPLLFARELPSTNDSMKELLVTNAPAAWTSIVCGRQTHGRGRPGNRWLSRRGDLTMTQWIDEEAIHIPGRLPLPLYVVSSCLNALERLGFPSIKWKYPNDLYASSVFDKEESAGKVGGMLVEPFRPRLTGRRGHGYGWIAGVGINLLSFQAERPDVGRYSGFLALEDLIDRTSIGTFGMPGPLAVALEIAKTLRETLTGWTEDAVREHLEARLLWKNRWIIYSPRPGQNGFGRVSGVEPGGELRLISVEGQAFLLGPNARNVRLYSEETRPGA